MTTAGVQPGFKLVARAEDSPIANVPASGGGTLGPLGQALGGILGELVKGVGMVIGGAIELAVGAFKWILEGIVAFAKQFGGFLAALFYPNPADVYPEYLLPVKADLEAAVKPIRDRIELAHSNINTALKDIGALRTKQQGILSDTSKLLATQQEQTNKLNALSQDLGNKYNELVAADKKVGQAVDDLVAFKNGMDARFAANNAALKNELNVAGQIAETQALIGTRISESLVAGGQISKAITSATTAADGKNFVEWWNLHGLTILEMQNWYNDWNNQQWKLQTDWNALQSQWNKRVMDTLNYQVQINSDQKDFNTFVANFVQVQKWYNANNTQLWNIQQAWNDQTKGWIATQNKINDNNKAWQEAQDQINSDLSNAVGALKDAQDEIVALQTTMQEYIPRKTIARKDLSNGVSVNPHFRIDIGAGTATALGTWVGEAFVRSYYVDQDDVIGADGGFVRSLASTEELQPIPQPDGSRVIKLPATTYQQTLLTVAIDYFVYQGTFRNFKASGSVNPSASSWYTVNSFTMPASATARIFFNVQWQYATYHSLYGVRITKNGALLASTGPSARIGPMLPGDSTAGYRWQNLQELSVALAKGDVLRFEVYSSGGTNDNGTSQRQIRQWDRTVAYLES